MTPREVRPPRPELVQRQARALGDPTRYDNFRFVAESRAPVREATLAGYLGFNHNDQRQHLAKLTEAGLLTEDRASPTTTGRPPFEYRLALAAMGSWGAPAEVVCQIHQGLAAGILDGMHNDVQVADLIVRPPAEAGCRLQRRPPAPAS